MNAIRVAGDVYLALGLTCWALLAVAYFRIGLSRFGGIGGFYHALGRTMMAVLVILIWPVIVIALLREEMRTRRDRDQL